VCLIVQYLCVRPVRRVASSLYVDNRGGIDEQASGARIRPTAPWIDFGSRSGVSGRGRFNRAPCYLQFEVTERVLREKHAREAPSEAERTSDLVYVLLLIPVLTYVVAQRDRMRAIERSTAGECPSS